MKFENISSMLHICCKESTFYTFEGPHRNVGNLEQENMYFQPNTLNVSKDPVFSKSDTDFLSSY